MTTHEKNIAAIMSDAPWRVCVHDDPQSPTQSPTPSALHAAIVFSAAGVQPGDAVEWSLSGWPLVQGKLKTHVTVKGIHIKNGVTAIEVIDDKGHGFRAYPSELRKVENDATRDRHLEQTTPKKGNSK